MKLISHKLLFYVLFNACITLFLVSCANTVVLNTWTDPEASAKPLKKVLVLTALRSEANSKQLQDALVMQLKQTGVDAVTGYSAFTSTGEPTKEQVMEYASQNQVDSVMVSRLTGENVESVYFPPSAYHAPYPYYGHWDTYYPHMYDYRGYTATYKFYYLETNVYLVSDKKLIWTAVTETKEPSNVAKEIQQFAEKIVASVINNGLI